MEAVLKQFAKPDHDPIALWRELVDRLRPARPDDISKVSENLRSLTRSLRRKEELRENLRGAIIRLLHERKTVSLYVSSGLLPSSGFFSETVRRISSRILPEVIDTHYMDGVIATVFNRVSDEVWVNAIPDEDWIALFNVLFDPAEAELDRRNTDVLPGPLDELIEALRMVSYHVSSIGLDPELVRIDPTLEEHESPFLAQNAELVKYLTHYREWWQDDKAGIEDEKHLAVMLDQCEEVVLRIRKRAAKLGTSLSLTFKLERLHQHLVRIAALLEVLTQLRIERNLNSIAPQVTRLLKLLIRAECRKNKLSDYWGQNVDLLALRMTESASRTGERYITTTRSEYFGIVRSAALGGLIIAFMAAFKVILERQGFAPLSEALTFCLNYGIGFVLIHILGGTVATKQPAMTANAIAASIGETKGKPSDLHALVELIARTVRSQFGAIFGNVGVAIPVAMLFAGMVYIGTGSHFAPPDYAQHLLASVHPLSGAVIFAGVAGVCLFLSGLIAGYYDNLCAYGRIPQRLLQLQWPRRTFGEARMQRVATYVESNLGALAGNFFFGFLLGGVAALGVLFGLPLDIRHIAFSSAYVGHAFVGLEFGLPMQLVVISLLGVLLIGLTNLAVSFALTLTVAMRARRILFSQGRELVMMVLHRLLTRPRDFFLPPPKSMKSDAAENSHGTKPTVSNEKGAGR